MRITILCSSSDHPVNAYLAHWIERHGGHHEIQLARTREELTEGEILFLISCTQLIDQARRARYAKTLVIHASDLPKGRGWSPHVWQIAAGEECITLSLLEAEDKVDSGDIWKKVKIRVPRHALCDEINALVFESELGLMDYAVEAFASVEPAKQDTTVQPTYFPKRTPEHSRIDPAKSIESQFDLIRVCDPVRYPAFFELHGHRYNIRLEKADG